LKDVEQYFVESESDSS